MYRMIDWIDGDASHLLGYDYWNDEDKERTKHWNVIDKGFKEQENVLEDLGISEELDKLIAYSNLAIDPGKTKGLVGLELAAGNCWSAPILFSKLELATMMFLDFSEHRIFKLAPYVLNHYKIPSEKVELIRGDFYNLKLDDECVDFVLLAQAFHHAENPNELLKEIKRILKPNGKVLIVGEPKVSFKLRFSFTKQYIKNSLQNKRIELRDLFPYIVFEKNDILGDIVYDDRGYRYFFRLAGFHYKKKRINNNDRCYLLTK